MDNIEKFLLWFFSIVLAMLLGFVLTMSLASASEREDIAVVLAQSCAGEAGWGADARGECNAQWWIYKKRLKLPAYEGWTLERMVRKYSAAVKYPQRRWILELNRDGERPKNWPKGIPWSRYRPRWLSILMLADNFVAGDVPDPSPSALHYGGRMDRHRLCPRSWRRIDTPWAVNFFYERR